MDIYNAAQSCETQTRQLRIYMGSSDSLIILRELNVSSKVDA